MERTVARNVDDRTAFAHRQLCADGRAVAKAHGPQAAARQKTAGFYMADVLRGPHLVLADVRHVKRVRPGQLAHFADELMRADAVLIILGTVILRLPCLDLRHPLRVLRIFDQRQKTAMSLSSFCVVSNALRLNLFKMYDASKDKKLKAKKEKKRSKKEDKTMKKIMHIEGMMCGHCEAAVKKALEALPQVDEAVVSHEAGTAELTLNAEIADDVLKKTVEDKDYTVTSVE